MATAQDIIAMALQEIAVYGANEVASAADANLALTVLNNMIDQWSTENLMCYAVQALSVVLTPGKAAYTIGQTGTPDINAVRPLNIETAYIQDPQGNNFPVDIFEADRWDLLQNRQQQSQIPSVLYYDPQYPLGILNLYPVPSIGYTLFFDANLQLTGFATLTSAFSLPPGYQDSMQHNLAVRLAAYFGVQLPDIVKELASETKGNIKRANLKEVVAEFDPELTRGGYGTYSLERFRQGR